MRRRFFKLSASKTLQFFAENSLTARVRRSASQKIADGNGDRHRVVMRCLQNCSEIFCKPFFRVCGIDFSNFRRRKRGNFSQKISKITRVWRCARHSIAFSHSPVMHCVSKCSKACLHTSFCMFDADFSNFRRPKGPKRCNFSRKIR